MGATVEVGEQAVVEEEYPSRLDPESCTRGSKGLLIVVCLGPH